MRNIAELYIKFNLEAALLLELLLGYEMSLKIEPNDVRKGYERR